MKGDTIALNGVSKNVTDVLKSVDDRAPLVNTKNVEDFRETKDLLGRSKNLGQGSASRPIDYGTKRNIYIIFFSDVLIGE